ncbi:MAG: hypothetical protein ACHQ53_01605 [Polyangiales bacterium]
MNRRVFILMASSALALGLGSSGCKKKSSGSMDGGSTTDSGTAAAGKGAAGTGGTGGKGTGGSGTGGTAGSAGSAGGGSGSGGSGGGAPTVKITAPTNNAQVMANAADPDVPVSFTVTGFTLMDPGKCAGAKMCGHIHVLVDGTACNDTGVPYNAAGSTSPIDAGLDYCPSISGTHTITLELHNDDHSAVKDSAGKTISDMITITVPAAGDAG